MTTINRNDYTAHETAYIHANYPEFPESWKPLNEKQINALFDEHAIYASFGDGVPLHIAFQLFGYDTVQIVRGWQKINPERNYVQQNIAAYYVTFRGFKTMAYRLNERHTTALQEGFLEAKSQDDIEFYEAEQAEKDAISAKRREAYQKRKAQKKTAESAITQQS